MPTNGITAEVASVSANGLYVQIPYNEEYEESVFKWWSMFCKSERHFHKDGVPYREYFFYGYRNLKVGDNVWINSSGELE